MNTRATQSRSAECLTPLRLDVEFCACGNRMMMIVQTLDRPPVGWHPLDVVKISPRKRDWCALMVSVPLDELKHCRCGVAALYVDPREYRPGNRIAREVWARVPGKHRDKDAAWRALQDAIATRH
jgi:hypothetical protein